VWKRMERIGDVFLPCLHDYGGGIKYWVFWMGVITLSILLLVCVILGIILEWFLLILAHDWSTTH
jgi:hypothetical protein